MATMTKEQIEQKMAQLEQLTLKIEELTNELKEAGAWPLDDDDLDQVTGGMRDPYIPIDYQSYVNTKDKSKPGRTQIRPKPLGG